MSSFNHCCRFHWLNRPCITSFPCILYNIIDFKSAFIWCYLLEISLRGCFEGDFFLFFLGLEVILFEVACITEFGESHALLSISKVRHIPLLLFLIPFWIIYYMLDLLRSHYHIKNGAEFLNLFFLVSNCIKQIFFFVFVLILDVF